MLGVGFDADDGHMRITTSDNYDVLMGSDESHEYLTQLIGRIETELKERGMNLEELDPAELGNLVKSLK